MKIGIIRDRCVGCGLCEENLPQIFRVGPETARVKSEKVPDALRQEAIRISHDCPAEAITVKFEKKDTLQLTS